MTPQKKLITIMRIKNDLLNKHMSEIPFDNFLNQLYFTKEDEKAIEGWSEGYATFTINRMIRNYKFNHKSIILFELTPSACPFCMLHDMECKDCEYRKNRNDISCTNQHSNFYIYNQFYKGLNDDSKIKISTLQEILEKE